MVNFGIIVENAPEQVRGLVKHLKAEFTAFIDTTEESIELATQYIAENVVGQTSRLFTYCFSNNKSCRLFS